MSSGDSGTCQSSHFDAAAEQRRHLLHDLGRQRLGGGEHLTGGERATGQPETDRLGPGEPPAGQEQVGGDREPGDARHRPVRVGVGQHSPAHVDEAELGVLGDQADVALHGAG